MKEEISQIPFLKDGEIAYIKADLIAFKRVRRVVKELIINFPEDAQAIWQQEEFLQLSNARIFLDKTIVRLENLANKASNP